MFEWLSGLPQGVPAFLGSVVGAAAGLIAIVLGALFNAHLNRRRDDRIRRIEIRTLAAALMAELSGLRSALMSNAEEVTRTRGGFFLSDVSESVKIYPEVVSKIGLFDAETIQKIIAAYIVIDQYVDNLTLMGGELAPDATLNRRLIHMEAPMAPEVAEMSRGTAMRIDEAVVRIRAQILSNL